MLYFASKFLGMPSTSEENYLKAIFKITFQKKAASTNEIAEILEAKASSVTDMVKKLSKKGLINYKKYYGVTLTEKGKSTAILIIRKHRLWETFLHDKLNFTWDEVHNMAEELEHVSSNELVNRLEILLGYPKHDPHGDPIPDKNGNLTPLNNLFISDLKLGEKAIITGIKDSSSEFLQYLEKTKLVLGAKVEIIDKISFDNSVSVMVEDSKTLNISHHISSNIYIKSI